VVRPGSDVTVVASLLMVHRSLEAAEALADEGIDVEVIDISWLRPLDMATVAESVARTGRLVIAEEQYHDGGWGSAIISRLATAGSDLAAPPVAVSMPEILISHSPPLEDAMIPSAERPQATRSAESPVEGSRLERLYNLYLQIDPRLRATYLVLIFATASMMRSEPIPVAASTTAPNRQASTEVSPIEPGRNPMKASQAVTPGPPAGWKVSANASLPVRLNRASQVAPLTASGAVSAAIQMRSPVRSLG